MSGPVEIVLVLAAVGYVLVRRLTGERANGMRLVILPAALSVWGLYEAFGAPRTARSLAFLIGNGVISVAIGALRGVTVRITERDGFAFVRYTAVTIGLWALNLAIKLGANIALHGINPKDAGTASTSLLLPVGLGLLVEGLVVCYRAQRGNHRVTWSRPRRDGAGIG